jgi:hypothetical protein
MSTHQNKRRGIGYKKSDSNGNKKAALIKKFIESGANGGNGSTQGGANGGNGSTQGGANGGNGSTQGGANGGNGVINLNKYI